jgi:hypothetical protein
MQSEGQPGVLSAVELKFNLQAVEREEEMTNPELRILRSGLTVCLSVCVRLNLFFFFLPLILFFFFSLGRDHVLQEELQCK